MDQPGQNPVSSSTVSSPPTSASQPSSSTTNRHPTVSSSPTARVSTSPTSPRLSTANSQSSDGAPNTSGLTECPVTSLPKEAQSTIAQIVQGGPFPYPANDGTRFGNYEGHLPKQPRNYYREYTVPTPGVSHRGARRIVTGGQGTQPEGWFYTSDHYDSFCFIPDAPGGDNTR
ncbi:ribonuclease domain-containing protein [Corynebacterium choanae]|uniref:ribonuclease domain-containing protein n=1 Tax=Corynebacterium choanae TaxID=1862358 RepID=UPI003CCC51B5